jgi:acetyl/propionyl-CoA carboxylase alpha subunit
VFVGPSPRLIALMGSKTAAREAAMRAGVPVVSGSDPFGSDAADSAVAEAAREVGYPLFVKAVAGGGGKGMRAVTAPEDLKGAVRAARSEAASAFGDSTIYLERQVAAPRHIEIQLLGDAHGTVLPFVERECSIQRRHQKVVEESPSPAIDAETRLAIAECAARIAREVGYTSAGTIEFLLDGAAKPPRWYFLEMNTRLQVEHPVTELVTGVDLVHWQLRIALGERLTMAPEQTLTPHGHAIECRVYAEDPDNGFLPMPGLVRALSIPGGPGIRDDRGIAAGSEIPTFYDSLISKLIVWGETRPIAIARLRRALREYRVVGLKTTIPFFQWLVGQSAFLDATFDTTDLDRLLSERRGRPFIAPDEDDLRDAAMLAALAQFLRGLRANSGESGHVDGGWRHAARTEGLR